VVGQWAAGQQSPDLARGGSDGAHGSSFFSQATEADWKDRAGPPPMRTVEIKSHGRNCFR
jgi:hypothetical protein